MMKPLVALTLSALALVPASAALAGPAAGTRAAGAPIDVHRELFAVGCKDGQHYSVWIDNGVYVRSFDGWACEGPDRVTLV